MKGKGPKWPRFHSTFDIIRAVEAGRFPDKVMMTVHPQRWTDNPVAWIKELVGQNAKNVANRLILQKRIKEGNMREDGGRMTEVGCQRTEDTPVEHPERGPGSTG